MRRLIAVPLALFLFAGNARAQDSEPEGRPVQFGWETTYASWYSFQGYDYSNRRPVLQPELSASVKNASISVWGNIDQARQEMNEVDVTLQWDWEGSRSSGSLGYASLQYPHREGWEPSQEIIGEIVLQGPLQPSASLHWDVDKGQGRYVELGIEGDLPASSSSIVLAAKLYVQDHYYGTTGITAAEARVGFKHVWGGVAWEPYVARILSWKSGDVAAGEVVPGWLFSLTLSPP